MEPERTRPSFKPSSLLDYWTIAVFLAAVVRLFLLKAVDDGELLAFLVPPVIAFCAKNAAPRHGTRIMAAIFLSLVAAGVAIGPFHALFPRLGGMGKGLPATDDRILTWYMFVYCGFVCVLPLFSFVRILFDHGAGRPTKISIFTCCLGIAVSSPMVLAIPVLFFKFGLWPVF